MDMFVEFDGTCPYCGEINITEGMRYDYSIDSDGVPNILNQEQYMTYAYCSGCGKTSIAIAESDGDTIKYKVYPDGIGHIFMIMNESIIVPMNLNLHYYPIW